MQNGPTLRHYTDRSYREELKKVDLKPRKITCASDRGVGRLEAEILLAHVLKRDRTWLRVHDDEIVTVRQRRMFESLVKRRLKHEPVAQIIGYKEFYGRPFLVSRDVLTPRPETELLIEQALDSHKHLFWDVGTGSGAIAITLALEEPRSRVIASDISRAALTLARKNARRLKAKNVTFIQAGTLSPTLMRRFQKDKRPLVIVANLPYLPASDKRELDPDVVKYEPHRALFGGEDGLEIIRRLLKQIAAARLNFQMFLLECDPRNAQKLKREAARLFPESSITIHRDLAGRMRIVKVNVRQETGDGKVEMTQRRNNLKLDSIRSEDR